MPTVQARPTIYNGIKMRSRLEAGYAAWLDHMGLQWEYEPHAFGSSNGQYLPDFLLHNVPVTLDIEPQDFYVEVKPTNPGHQIEPQARILFASKPDHQLLVEFPHDNGWQEPTLWFNLDQPNGNQPTAGTVCWVHHRRLDLPPDHPKIRLAFPLSHSLGPWPDGYWKAT